MLLSWKKGGPTKSVDSWFHFVWIKESRRISHISLSGERGGPSAAQMVESRIHYVNQKEWRQYVTLLPQNYEIFDFHTIDSPVFAGEWWKVECCMLGNRKACCCTFDSYSALKQIIRPQEWLCHSWLRMVQSLQITGVKRNVLFLQRASMRKLIKGKHEKRCSFLERKGDRRSRWIVDSTLFE